MPINCSGFTQHKKGELLTYTADRFIEAGFMHFFAARFGGVSSGAFDSLNVSTTRTDKNGLCDKRENVLENYARALSLLDVLPEDCVTTVQVHSDRILRVKEEDTGKGILPHKPPMEDCDGLILDPSNHKTKGICIKTADCVPILFANIKTGTVAAVHAGWRGTTANIAGKAAALLAKESSPDDVIAAIGPHIGFCCYEVGESVYHAANNLLLSVFASHFDIFDYFTPYPSCSLGCGKYNVSLAKLNKALIANVGISENNISVCNICTCCSKNEKNENLFFSHRASGGYSGTFLTAIRSALV
jgi:Uncharacterized conserved protein